VFLSFTTIINAEIAAIKHTPFLIEGSGESGAKLKEGIDNLDAHAHGLACLLSAVAPVLKGVPLALVGTTLNAAKGMILGNWQVEEDEEELFSKDLNQIDLNESPRREAGWIIFGGLLHLGNQWVGSKLTITFKLWNVNSFKHILECIL